MMKRIGAAITIATTCILLGGCGMTAPVSESVKAPITSGSARITGMVHGGQQPVSGATIQLYAVGNAGSKSAATPLLTQTVLTTGDGGFGITGLWNCNDTATYGSDPLLYLVASGGNPGLGAGGNNPALAMMTAIGRCSTLTASSFIYVNEITTVASTYALAQFMGDYSHIGTSAANMSALANAFGTASTLANMGTGVTPGPSTVAGESVPVVEINTLANIMAACINSNGGGACSSLFNATKPTTGTLATDTIGSMLQVVQAPAHNVSAIFNMMSPTVPFQPTLSVAPTDWTMMVKFTGGGLSSPAGVAIDASGNAWIANAGGGAVTGMSSNGALLTGTNGYTGTGSIFGAQGIAVDKSGNVWLADSLLSSVIKLTVVSGAVQFDTSYTNAVSGPTGLAIDGQNHVWVTNFGDGSVSELDNTGTPIGASPLNAGGTLQSPAGIAIDALGNAWVTDNSSSVLVKFDKNQNLLSGAGYSDSAMLAPEGVAIDLNGAAWVAGNGNSAVSEFKANGASQLTTPYMGGGLNMPAAIAMDGAGVAWVTNSATAGSMTKIVAGATMPFGGLGSLNAPAGIAVDASGNVWTANSGDDSVSKFVGLATPVVTPLAANVGP